MITPRRRRASFGRWLLRLTVGAALVVGAAWAVFETAWGRERLRTALCDVIRDELGLEAQLAFVRLEPTLLPPGVEIIARGIELRHPVEGRLAVATRLSVRPSLTRLLMGRLDLTRIELDSPRVRLVIRDGELRNGPTLPESRGGRTELPFRYLAVRNASVHVVGDAVATGELEGIEAELNVAGGRAVSIDLRVASGTVHHVRGDEAITQLVLEGVVDLDRGAYVHRLRLGVTSGRVSIRNASVPFPFHNSGAGAFDVHVDVTRLGTLFAEDLGVSLVGALDARGHVDVADGHVVGNADLTLDHVAIRDRGLGSPLELGVTFDEHELRIVRGRVHMPDGGGSASLSGRVGLEAPYPIEAALAFHDLEFATLMKELGVTPDAIVTWLFNGAAELHGQVIPFRLMGTIDTETTNFLASAGPWHDLPRTRIIGVPRGHIRGRVDIDEQALRFLDLDVQTEHSRLRCDTSISFGSTFSVHATSDHLDVLDVSPLTTFPLAGVGELEVTLDGEYSDPRLAARGFFRGFAFDSMPLGDIEVDAEFEEGASVVHFPRIRGVHGDTRYVVNDLRIDLTRSIEIDAQLDFEVVTFEDMYRTFHMEEDERFDPYIGMGHGSVRAHYTMDLPEDGPTGTLVTDIDLTIDRATLAGFAFEDGSFRGQLRWFDFTEGFDGAEVDVDEFTLRKGLGSLAVAGSIGRNGALDLRMVADRIALEDTEGLREDWPLLEGEYGVLGTISNSLAAPHMDLDLTISNVTWAGRRVGDGRAYVKLTDQFDPWIRAAADLDPDDPAQRGECVRGRLGLLNANWPPDPPARTPHGPVVGLEHPEAFVICGSGLGGSLDLDLALGFTSVFPHRGRVTMNHLDLGPFLDPTQDANSPHGHVTGAVDLLAGDLQVEHTSTGRIRLDELALDASGVSIRNQGPWDISLRRGTVKFESATLVGNGTELRLGGTASSTDLAVALEGSVGMELFAAMSPDLASATGSTDVRILLRGPLLNPEVVGEATFSQVSLQHAALPLPLSGLAGRIEFNERRFVIDHVTGRLGSGTIAVDGSASVDGGRMSGFAVHIGIDDVAFRPEDGLEVAFGGALDVEWDESRAIPLARGNIEFDRVRYSRPVQVTPTLGQLYRPTRAVVDAYDPSRDFIELDIRVLQRRPFEVRNNLVDFDIAIEDDERPFRIVGTNQRPGVLGTLSIPRGTMVFRSASFEVRRGTIVLDDPNRIHPRFDVLAATEIRRSYDSTAPAFRIQLAATGDSDAFRLDASSVPALSSQDIMLLLMVGMTSSELQNLQASQLSTAALDALSSLTGVQGRISDALRVVDEVSLTTMYHPVTNRPEPQLTVGTRITDRIRVTASTGLTSETRSIRTTAAFRLDEHTSVQAVYDNINRETASAFGNLGVDVRYRLEFE